MEEKEEELEDAQLKVVDAFERLKICQECEKYLAQAKICGMCKCFMPLKTRIERAKCPLGKW